MKALTGGPGRTSIRVGWGMFYSTFEGATNFNEIGDAPFGAFYGSPVPPEFVTPFVDRGTGHIEGQRFPVPLPTTNTVINWPNFLPIDDSPFTNDYYMPSFSDYFFRLDRPVREAFNQRHILTSDGVSESTLREIYQRAYVHRFVNGAVDLFALYPNREVLHVTGDGSGGWDLAIGHNDLHGVTEHIEVDVIVWATGFRPARMDFLAPLSHRLEREGDEYRIDESFAAVWDGPPDRNIFVQNGARQQRGLADPNLSLVAWRAQRILDRLRGVNTENQTGSFIEWSAKLTAGDPDADAATGRVAR